MSAFFKEIALREKLHDSDIEEAALLLERCGHTAFKCPRTYIVLTTIGCLEVLDRLLAEGFSDGLFPVRTNNLPSFLSPSVKESIVRAQGIIETKSLDLFNGKHCTIGSIDNLPFKELGRIGSGSWGEVRKIQSKIDFKQYALKRVQRRAWGTQANEEVRQILAEMKIMKILHHIHVARYIGSYATDTQLGIIIWPIADTDLARYMQEASTSADLRPTLQSFFGCLAAAITYLHANSVKHRDLKPQNVLVHNSNVLVTDFGLSRDFLDMTSGYTMFTPRYAPPEVAFQDQRNESADIWSLGCVFLEMVAALHGHDVQSIRDFYASQHSGFTNYHANPDATHRLISTWELEWNEVDRRPLGWVRSMLVEQRGARPTAAEVWELATTVDLPDLSATTFSGLCCASPDDRTSSTNGSMRSCASSKEVPVNHQFTQESNIHEPIKPPESELPSSNELATNKTIRPMRPYRKSLVRLTNSESSARQSLRKTTRSAFSPSADISTDPSIRNPRPYRKSLVRLFRSEPTNTTSVDESSPDTTAASSMVNTISAPYGDSLMAVCDAVSSPRDVSHKVINASLLSTFLETGVVFLFTTIVLLAGPHIALSDNVLLVAIYVVSCMYIGYLTQNACVYIVYLIQTCLSLAAMRLTKESRSVPN